MFDIVIIIDIIEQYELPNVCITYLCKYLTETFFACLALVWYSFPIRPGGGVGGGGSKARMTKLTAANQKPLIL